MLTEEEIQICKKIWLDDFVDKEEHFDEVILKDVLEPYAKHLLEPLAKSGIKYPPIERQFLFLLKAYSFCVAFKILFDPRATG